ncbi:MAG: HEAT repeat domain-containing protein, partial [Deltaproteobacteria bacterium]|nr:HEAT repeat domain-containing protein [Deltaproteobacteria bacterium]
VRWLTHWDDSLRIIAATALGRLGGKGVLSTLVRALVDPAPKVRLKVVAALAILHDKRAVVPLLSRVEDSQTDIRLATINALGTLGDPRAVIPIMGRLSDPSSKIRAASITALGKLRDRRSLQAIVRRLSDHAAPVVGAAIATLGQLRHRGATEPLVGLLHSGNHRHRQAIALALARIGSNLALRALTNALGSSTLAAAAQAALSKAKKQNPEFINSLLTNPRTPRRAALAAVEIARAAKLRATVPALIEQLDLKRLPQTPLIRALGAIGDPRAERTLLGLLDDDRIAVQLSALKALGPLLDGRSATPLVQCLSSKNHDIRRIAIRYLTRLRSPDTTRALARFIRTRNLDEARQAAAALAAIGDRRAIPDLLWLLSHRDRLLRRLAVEGLAQIATPPKALPHRVLALCRRHGATIRSNCLQALGTILRGKKDPAVISYLLDQIAHDDHTLFLSALDALAALRAPGISQALLARLPSLPLALKRHAIEVLGSQEDGRRPAISALRSYLHAPESSLRAAAAWALSKLQAPDALDDLEKALRQSGWEARTNIAAALATLRQPRSLPLLRHLARDKDPFVRANALLGIGWLGDKTATPQLLTLVQRDPNPWVRGNALRSLFRLAPHPLDMGGHRYANVAALAQVIAQTDLDRRVRHLAQNLATQGLPAISPRSARHAWIGLYLLDGAGKPLRNKPFALVTPTGLIKASRADSRSQSWEEQLPPGHCYVTSPPSSPPPS